MSLRKTLESLILMIILLGSAICHAQNAGSIYAHTESQNEQFKVVFVNLKHFMNLSISTTGEPSSYVTNEKQSGEYKNALILNTQVLNDTLFVTDPVNPIFEFPQDKLSAHKITESKAELRLPEGKVLFLNLSEAVLNLDGQYKNVIINIHSGNMKLSHMSGNIQVTSVNANLVAIDLNSYSVQASSRNGSVTIENEPNSTRYLLEAESINGNIQSK